MKYFIALFYLVGSIYAQCNADNWEKFYNSDSHDMESLARVHRVVTSPGAIHSAVLSIL